MSRLAWFVLLIPSVSMAQVQLSGKISSLSGTTPALGHIHVDGPTDEQDIDLDTDKKGRFVLKLDQTGLVMVEFSAVGHLATRVPVWVQGEEKNKVEVKLVPYLVPDPLKEVNILIEGSEFDGMASSQPMTLAADGAWHYSFTPPGEQLAYQVYKYAGGHTCNGTLSDTYRYDGGGDFYSVLNVTPGQEVDITFDPAGMVRGQPDMVASLTFKKADSELARITTLLHSRVATQEAVTASYEVWTRSGKSPDEFKPVQAQVSAELHQQLGQGEIPPGALGQATLHTWLNTVDEDKPPTEEDFKRGELALARIPADSPLWMLGGVTEMASLIPDATQRNTWVDNLLASQPKDQRLAIYAGLVGEAAEGGDMARAGELFTRMEADFPEAPITKMYKSFYDRNRPIQPGHTLPILTTPSLEDANREVSTAGFEGKYLLVDLWATWCGPCVAEMEGLHETYENFHKKGLEILSLSLDESRDDVVYFRDHQWKMPWKHAMLPGGFTGDYAKSIQLAGIPTAVLIDQNGLIVAEGFSLRGEELVKTLTPLLP